MANTVNLGDAKDLVKEKLDLQEKEREFLKFEVGPPFTVISLPPIRTKI